MAIVSSFLSTAAHRYNGQANTATVRQEACSNYSPTRPYEASGTARHGHLLSIRPRPRVARQRPIVFVRNPKQRWCSERSWRLLATEGLHRNCPTDQRPCTTVQATHAEAPLCSSSRQLDLFLLRSLNKFNAVDGACSWEPRRSCLACSLANRAQISHDLPQVFKLPRHAHVFAPPSSLFPTPSMKALVRQSRMSPDQHLPPGLSKTCGSRGCNASMHQPDGAGSERSWSVRSTIRLEKLIS